MPRNGSGTYSLPAGNPVVSGTTIESSWANTTLSDIGTAMTDSLSRSGQGGMTAAFRAADGTSSVPGIAWSNETGSGFYRAGSNDVRFVIATTEAYKVTGTTVTFSLPLTATANVSFDGGTFVFNEAGADKDARFEGDTDANLLFTDASTDRVGVGTATPSVKLDVNGGVSISASDNLTWGGAYGSTTPAISGSAGFLAFYPNGSTSGEQMRLTSTSLGLGTTSPTFGSGTGVEIQRAGIATLRLDNITDSNSFELYADSAANGINLRGRDSSPMVFWTGNNERARIDSSGNLGIGTASPAAKFDLNGDYKEAVVTANTGTAYTINIANGTVQILTLTGNCTFTFPTATAGKSFMILLKQDGTGGRTATWPASVKWPSSVAPTVTSTANRLDKYVFTADGTNWYGSLGGLNYTV